VRDGGVGLLKKVLLALDALCIVWLIYLIVDVSDGGQGATGAIFLFWGAVVLGGLFLVALITGWVVVRDSSNSLGSLIGYWILPPVVVFLGLAVCCSGLSYYLFLARFGASRPALEKYVESTREIASSNGDFRPQIVGLLPVKETEVLPHAVRLITSECEVLNDCGLVFSPDQLPPRLGEDFYVPIGKGWWFWHRSW
jgi:hypothetical protein